MERLGISLLVFTVRNEKRKRMRWSRGFQRIQVRAKFVARHARHLLNLKHSFGRKSA